MLVTVQGTYENGTIRLDEPAPAAPAGPVLITFLAEAAIPASSPPGRPRFSFDEALALTAESSHISVADEVIAEREEER